MPETRRVGAFDRVVCAVDGTPEAEAAAAQARLLVSPLGSAEVVSVIEVPVAPYAPYGAGVAVLAAHERAERSLAAAGAAWPGVERRLLEGPTLSRLLDELVARNATLVAVGAGGHRRASGILLGSVSTGLLHRARCSVLVARPAASFPRSIVAGTDGSAGAQLAVAAARDLCERLVAPLQLVAARGGQVDESALAGETGVRWDDRAPLDALLAASSGSDLVVVGSRGLQGVRALGSVGERLAHRARCSVLVVKPVV